MISTFVVDEPGGNRRKPAEVTARFESLIMAPCTSQWGTRHTHASPPHLPMQTASRTAIGRWCTQVDAARTAGPVHTPAHSRDTHGYAPRGSLPRDAQLCVPARTLAHTGGTRDAQTPCTPTPCAWSGRRPLLLSRHIHRTQHWLQYARRVRVCFAASGS